MQTRTFEGQEPATSTARVGTGFAALTLATHAANYAFVVADGRLLDPGAFGDLVALLGIVLLGLAPGMALQALAVAGVVGATNLVDRGLGRRLGVAIGLLVTLVTIGVWVALSIDGWLVLVVVPAAATLLPMTAVNEGLLQGHGRFTALGLVMLAGATTKLVLGLAGMVSLGNVDAAATAVLAGAGVQLLASSTTSRRHTAPRGADVSGAVRHAVIAMSALLAVVHLDAVVAPTQLPAVEAGRYATGVTAARVTFWLPQFAILLWFPRLVVDRSGRLVRAALVGVVCLGVIGTLGALAVGPWLVEVVFGPELGAVGPDLWRFVWIGVGALGLQVLTLADIAAGRRGTVTLLAIAGLLVSGALLVGSPIDAGRAASLVVMALLVVTAAGATRILLTRQPTR